MFASMCTGCACFSFPPRLHDLYGNVFDMSWLAIAIRKQGWFVYSSCPNEQPSTHACPQGAIDIEFAKSFDLLFWSVSMHTHLVSTRQHLTRLDILVYTQSLSKQHPRSGGHGFPSPAQLSSKVRFYFKDRDYPRTRQFFHNNLLLPRFLMCYHRSDTYWLPLNVPRHPER